MLVPRRVEAPLWRAVEQGEVGRVGALLDEGEAVDQLGGPYGSTPLGWAAFAGDVPLVRLCLEKGAKPNARAKKGSTPLHMATWNGDHAEVVALLLEAGADPRAANGAGLSPLAQARWFDKLEREASVESVFAMAEWREAWGKPPAGRGGVIAKLEAATAAEEANKEEGAEEDDAKSTAAPESGEGGEGAGATKMEEAPEEEEEVADEEEALGVLGGA